MIILKLIFFLAKLITGLIENDLNHYSHLLTGYIRCPKFLKKVAGVYNILKKKNPDLLFSRYLFYHFIIIAVKNYNFVICIWHQSA